VRTAPANSGWDGEAGAALAAWRDPTHDQEERMADFASGNVFDNMPGGNPGINMGTTGSMHDVTWGTEEWGATDQEHWRQHYSGRPYVRADRGYDYYEPAYRYGTVAARRHAGREWNDVEGDLSRGWNEARGASQSTWDDVKDAVHDAWDRVRGRT
jgi:hypothetical protein